MSGFLSDRHINLIHLIAPFFKIGIIKVLIFIFLRKVLPDGFKH